MIVVIVNVVLFIVFMIVGVSSGELLSALIAWIFAATIWTICGMRAEWEVKTKEGREQWRREKERDEKEWNEWRYKEEEENK